MKRKKGKDLDAGQTKKNPKMQKAQRARQADGRAEDPSVDRGSAKRGLVEFTGGDEAQEQTQLRAQHASKAGRVKGGGRPKPKAPAFDLSRFD